MSNQVRGTWPKRVFQVSLVLAALAGGALLVVSAFFYAQLPDISSLSNYQPKRPLRVFTADGVDIGGFGSERRVYQRIDQIPQLMKDSLLAVVDHARWSANSKKPCWPIALSRSSAKTRFWSCT